MTKYLAVLPGLALLTVLSACKSESHPPSPAPEGRLPPRIGAALPAPNSGAAPVEDPLKTVPRPVLEGDSPQASATVEAPPPFTGIVAAHNQWRRMVGVAPLVWSERVAQHAQEWADQLRARNHCGLEHRSLRIYGENLAGGRVRLTPTEVVSLWADEQRNYDPASKTCLPGRVCGHYTQIVWAGSQELGCGYADCGGDEVWVCNYNPPGNYIGQAPY